MSVERHNKEEEIVFKMKSPDRGSSREIAYFLGSDTHMQGQKIESDEPRSKFSGSAQWQPSEDRGNRIPFIIRLFAFV